MLIENIFSSFLASTYIHPTKELVDYVLETTSKDQCRRQDLINQSNFLDLNLFPIRDIVDIVQDNFNDLHNKIELSDTHRQIVSEAWVNIGNNINIDSIHCHPGRVFSAVYYLEADNDCGDLIFTNPNNSLVHTLHPTFIKSYNCFNSHNYRLIPKKGLLVIFPSYLQHYVQPNLSKGNRISLAFNSQVIKLCP